MIKALIKKQLKEMLSMFMKRDKKKGKSIGSAVLYAVLMIYCVAVFFGMFYNMMNELCPAFFGAGMGWFYFAFAALTATILAVIGSVFMAQSQLYHAKDNELLLAMPIPPSIILFSRMISLYIQNFFFEALVFLPAIIVYFRQISTNGSAVIFCILLLFILPLLSLAVTCILGWLVAFISARLGNKSIVTVIFSLGFLAVYFYFFTRLNKNIQSLITNSREIGEKVKGAVYPFYQMGEGAQGDVKGFVVFTLITVALFAIVYFALSISFIKIATSNRGEKKKKYKEKTLKVRSISKTLFQKELLHFGKSPIYILNCGMGTVFLIIIAAALIVKNDIMQSVITEIPEIEKWISMIGCGIICMIASTNVVTAPSISLEGKNLWILQSAPVSGWKVMCGKLKLHMIVTAPAALVCSAVMAFTFEVSPLMAVLLFVSPVVFIFFCGVLGLVYNLKFPKLNWSSEAIAVKQCLSVLFSLFSGWGIMTVFIIIYIFLCDYIPAEGYVVICTVVLIIVSALIIKWLKKRGVEILETL